MSPFKWSSQIWTKIVAILVVQQQLCSWPYLGISPAAVQFHISNKDLFFSSDLEEISKSADLSIVLAKYLLHILLCMIIKFSGPFHLQCTFDDLLQSATKQPSQLTMLQCVWHEDCARPNMGGEQQQANPSIEEQTTKKIFQVCLLFHLSLCWTLCVF